MPAATQRPNAAQAEVPEPTHGDRFRNAVEYDPPAGEREREAYWNDTLLLAVAELRAELADADKAVRSKAAHKIIDLERTKMRHGRRIAGTGGETTHMAEDEFQARMEEVGGRGVTPPGKGEARSAGATSVHSQAADRLKAALRKDADSKAVAETEAFGYYAARVRAVVDDLARKCGLGWGPMSKKESESIVRRSMEMKGVTAVEIDGRDLLIVVMNMVGDEKERMEKAKAGTETVADPAPAREKSRNSDSAGTSADLAC